MSNLLKFLSKDNEVVPDIPKNIPKTIVHNDLVKVGQVVRLNPSSYWARFKDDFNPIDMNGVVIEIKDTEIYVQWDNGYTTAYYRFWDDNFL